MDVISQSCEKLGFSSDDVLSLLERYTPSSILSTYHRGAMRGEAALHAEATGELIAEPTNDAGGATIGSRLDKLWTISNLSLVIPSLVLLLAAYLFFERAADVRDRIINHILEEDRDINQSQRKGFQENLSSEIKHIYDLQQLEIEMMKARLDQIKATPKP
jgi:hypothetical protein